MLLLFLWICIALAIICIIRALVKDGKKSTPRTFTKAEEEIPLRFKEDDSSERNEPSLDISRGPLVFVDVETTGLSPMEDAVVQLSAIRYVEKKEVGRINTYINPGRHIPASSTKIHGISDMKVVDAPAISSMKEPFMDLIKGAVLVGYNTKFDLDFLDFAFDGALHCFGYIDVLYIARGQLSLPNYRLSTVAKALNIKPGGRFHDAAADCEATASIFFKLVKKYDKKAVRTFFSMIKQEQEIKARNHWSEGEEARIAGNFDDAFACYQKAEELGFGRLSICMAHAKIYRKQKDCDKEIAVLDEAIQLCKESGYPSEEYETRRSRVLEIQASRQKREEEERQRAIRREERAERRRLEEELAKSKPKKEPGRAVIQCADDGSVIQEFETVSAAAKAMGISPKGIRSAANGTQKRAAGFIWRYADTAGPEE